MVLAAAVWGHQWEGSFVMRHSDNTAVVSQVNLLHSQDPVASSMLCCLAYFQAHFDFWLRAVHIPGVRNIGAVLIEFYLHLSAVQDPFIT